jgi:hypothetical protein
MRLLYVRLRQSELANLIHLAEVERRHPRDEAAILLREALDARQSAATNPSPEVDRATDH